MRANTTTAVLVKAPAIVGGREPKDDDFAGREPSATAVSASAAPRPTPISKGLAGNALGCTSFGASASDARDPLFCCTRGFRACLAREVPGLAFESTTAALFDMA